MAVKISDEIARASGLLPEDAAISKQLVDEWQRHYKRNALRDRYYHGHVGVKDLGVSVSKKIASKLDPHVDWAAKCVDWFADRVQFEGVKLDDEEQTDMLYRLMDENDMKNLVHKTVLSALRHSCAFLTVTDGDQDAGEPSTVISGYPLTASSAIYDEAHKRIKAGLVVVASERPKVWNATRKPLVVYVLTDTDLIVISRFDSSRQFAAEYIPHSMGRVPMEPIAYHATLDRPFGRSRITSTVMSLVDDAQREMLNMTAAASFSAWPQKYLLGADPGTAKDIGGQPFSAFIGSLFVATVGKKGQIPQFGQLTQLSMQPHVDYMRSLAAQLSNATGVPLSSLGVVSDNPSSAEAIYAGEEDAIVDIQSFINSCKRSLATVAVMALASEAGTSYGEALSGTGTVSVNFHNPAMPSFVSQSDAIVKQVSAMPWLASSDVVLRELGYTEEQIIQLRSDRRRNGAIETLNQMASMETSKVDNGNQ